MLALRFEVSFWFLPFCCILPHRHSLIAAIATLSNIVVEKPTIPRRTAELMHTLLKRNAQLASIIPMILVLVFRLYFHRIFHRIQVINYPYRHPWSPRHLIRS
ncbi:hypothetical protein EDB19DRAFT_1782958 [Suillus lakei]|nr:hypothetical protein EDB19DRAFT_1782958 [Suillus lakei]